MVILTVKSSAKVNLTLDVLERDASTGYHRIQTIFHEVEKLYDTLIFEKVEHSPLRKSRASQVWIELKLLGECRGKAGAAIPTDETNTILKAVRLVQNEYGLQHKGMRITLEKRIPPESGLGGAASNAAVTLSALSSLWGLNLPRKKLLTLAAKIGMDVPFFILGGCALGMHYGEHLMPIPTLDTLGLKIETIPAKVKVSTAEAYKNLNLSRCGKNAKKTSELVKILKGEKVIESRERILNIVESLLHNDFETPSLKGPNHLTGTGGAQFRLMVFKPVM